jgi:hypothetical protein
MIQRRNMIVCLALLAVFAFAAVADAGLFCGCRAACGRRNRPVRVCVCTCWTKDGRSCAGSGTTVDVAKANARAKCNCTEADVVMWECHWEIHRRGLFGRCRIEVCEVPVCETCAPSAAVRSAGGVIQAHCPTEGGGSCIGYGKTCDAAKADARAKCTKPITGPCICTNLYKRRQSCR